MEVIMENLYLQINNNNMQIEKIIVKRYHLEKGTMLPFTRIPLADKTGDCSPIRFGAKVKASNNSLNNRKQKMFTIAESIDISQVAHS